MITLNIILAQFSCILAHCAPPASKVAQVPKKLMSGGGGGGGGVGVGIRHIYVFRDIYVCLFVFFGLVSRGGRAGCAHTPPPP